MNQLYDDGHVTWHSAKYLDKSGLPGANTNFGKVRGYDTEGTLYIREKR